MYRPWSGKGASWLAAIVASLLGTALLAAEPEASPTTPPETKASSDWWLGVQCRPIDEALRTHLGLAESEGLVVEKTVPNSPADKAGLQRHDVLLSVDGKPLKSPLELIEAVNAAEGKKLTLQYFRGGQKSDMAITPEHRPDWAQGTASNARIAQESEMVRRWLEQLQPGSPGAPMRFRLLHPGTILPSDAPAHPPLPANVSVTITKRGGDLARVVVTRENEKWEVAENELDKLPKDLIPYVEFMLGRTAPGSKDAARLFEFAPDWVGRGQATGSGAGSPSVEAPEARQRETLEERLDKMNQQLDQLQRSVEALRQERAR